MEFDCLAGFRAYSNRRLEGPAHAFLGGVVAAE